VVSGQDFWLLTAWNALTRQAWFKSVHKVGAVVLAAIGAFEAISDIPEAIAKYRTFFQIVGHALLKGVSAPLGFLLLLAMIAIPLFVAGQIVIAFLSAVTFGRAKWIGTAAIVFLGAASCVSIVAALYADIRYRGAIGAFTTALQHARQCEDDHRFKDLQNARAKQYNDAYRSCQTRRSAKECLKEFPLYPIPYR
jgi:hypothetical protein